MPRSERSGVRITAGVRDFSILLNVQPGSGSHPALYSMDAGDLSRGGRGGGQSGQGVKLTAYLLVPRLRKSGATYLLTLYPFIVHVY